MYHYISKSISLSISISISICVYLIRFMNHSHVVISNLKMHWNESG